MTSSDPRRIRYWQHKSSARRRGIPFLLTFEQWWAIWAPHWTERGRKGSQLVMARKGDIGPYADGNVTIITARANRLQRRPLAGSANPAAKLTEGDVDRVRDMLACRCKQRDIGDWFGVDQTTISQISRGEHWRQAA